MSQPSINPVAKSLYLCDGTIGMPGQKTDLMGLFNSISPPQYPHLQRSFVIFAQFVGGLGQVPFYFDIRYATDSSLVRSTPARLLYFTDRDRVIQMAYTLHDCLFPQPGVYVVELFCNGQWVADTTLELR